MAKNNQPETEKIFDKSLENRTKNEVLDLIRKVNDLWQRENSEPAGPFWHPAAYHTGNIAAYEVTGDESYKKYSEAWAEKNQWKGAASDDKKSWKYNYSEVMEYEMSTPNNDYWWWADGLYMVMPVMTKLYKATGNPLYLEKLYEYFSFAKNLMYDKEEGLFFRDAKYVYPAHKTPNGKKDFWARGNGWVFAGLAKVLQDLPPQRIYRSLSKFCQSIESGTVVRRLLDTQLARC